ncbi:MAG: GNAT family N-acetyltransferase [Bacteroidales bacterium]|nr:GNAT family N-acetyltransferase [Bacteroidales bacterium]
MLQNDDIKLRAPEPDDIDFLLQLENDTQLWHVTQTWVPYSRFDMEQYVFSQNKQDVFSLQQVRFMIELTKEGQPVGTIDLFEIDAVNKRAGVGIVLVEAFRGRGYAGSALELVAEYVFDHLNLHQLFCHVEEDNEASLKLFQGHGFQVSGMKKEWNLKNGSFTGEYLMQRFRY